MKKGIAVIAAASISACILNACNQTAAGNQQTPGPSASLASASPAATVLATIRAAGYKDGTYNYVGKPDIEGYHVEGGIVVSGGGIVSMQWKIVDGNGRVFDATYKDVYGDQVYKQQCRDNWSGMQGFVPELLTGQDPKAVDTVSGATWAYNKFEEAAKALAAQAK